MVLKVNQVLLFAKIYSVLHEKSFITYMYVCKKTVSQHEAIRKKY